MRAAPAVCVTVERFGLWRAAVAALMGAAAASVLGWCWTVRTDRPWPELLAAVALLLPVLGGAVPLLRPQPLLLRWDGRRWHWEAPGSPPGVGELQAVLDLGSWLLLRLRPEAGQGRRAWLPVQRRGLEGVWHAFRCAVYSPRPDVGQAAGADRHPPSEARAERLE